MTHGEKENLIMFIILLILLGLGVMLWFYCCAEKDKQNIEAANTWNDFAGRHGYKKVTPYMMDSCNTDTVLFFKNLVED